MNHVKACLTALWVLLREWTYLLNPENTALWTYEEYRDWAEGIGEEVSGVMNDTVTRLGVK